jgi:LuxR family transcriptional regulator, maltose regulon positive regulatory protein
MMPALLQAKIQLPPLRAQHISRERVLHLLTAAADARLLLVSAPAGFGKSSCLVAWAHQLQQQGTVVAWYALDERDNDPAHFAAYLLVAVRALPLAEATLPESGAPLALAEVVDLLLNAVAAAALPLVLFLDDYHLIHTPRIHAAVGRLCEYLPPNMQMAIGTRADPPLPLARLRVQGAVAELRMADLSFSRAEVAHWLQQRLGRQPSAPLLNQLYGLTEGWAAALALVLMSRPQLDEAALEQQLQRYSQTRRHMFAYVAAEVFERQAADIQAFLLDTSVLNWLQPDLCNALTGRSDTALLLSRLAGESLFVIPLSEREPVYRYHHLLAQFLRQYLQLQDGERYRACHRQAAEWLAAHDNPVDAVPHALAAEDLAYAAQLIETGAWQRLTSRGEIMTVLNWLPAFPKPALRNFPRLCLYFSRALYLTGELRRSQDYVQLAAEALSDDAEPALQAIAAGYRATLAAYQGDVVAGRHWIAQAQQLQHTVDELNRVRIVNTAAFLHFACGDLAAARAGYAKALALSQQFKHQYLMLDAHYYLARIDLLAADLDAVERRCAALLDREAPRSGPLATIMVPLAMARYQRNQLVEAEILLREAITLMQRAAIPDVLWLAQLALAELLLARGDPGAAATSIAQARRTTQDFDSPIIAALIDAAEARRQLRSGRIAATAEWAQRYRQYASLTYQDDTERLTLAQVQLAQGEAEAALATLAEIVPAARAAGRIDSVIQGHVWQALAWQAAGAVAQALAALEAALLLAAPQGIVRYFLDAGAPLLPLLRRIDARSKVAAYARQLLAIAEQTTAQPHPADTLTEREIEVLARIAAGASNQTIADELVISVGTVKTHIHRLMAKLDAQNRTEAVSKARHLNLLPD